MAYILRTTFQPRIIVQRQLRLIQQPVSPRPARLTRSIQPNTTVANPDEQTPHSRSQRHRRMRHPRPRLQHETRHPPTGNVRPHAVLVHDHERTVKDVEVPLFSTNKTETRSFMGMGLRGGEWVRS